ncbi:double-strand break repair protein AddB [Rhodobacteraceae bacterium CCMM004]|nr:double-strand break repair protein AddB [Rhodobacteraceae bacterium CCMM004]
MFAPSEGPRLFGTPPGVDFAEALVAGLTARLGDAPPESWARVDILVNTRRMQRRLREVLAAGPARLLPRVRTIADLMADADLPPPVSPLRRRLDLARLIDALTRQQPDLAGTPPLALAESLAALLDEMQAEGVAPETLERLDVGPHSAHWTRSLRFVGIARTYLEATGGADAEARQRAAALATVASWEAAPPGHPVIVAGSTGSRGATAMLIQAAARLPQGAAVLPGVDRHMPQTVWERLSDAMTGEDHPQFRFARLAAAVDLAPGDIAPWTADDPSAARNRLISLALRPAPVTDQWLSEGPALGPVDPAAAGLSLIEAVSPQTEALAIALRLRQAVEDRQTAMLITPDRVLVRRVVAALDRWRIVPDDSAGRPLGLSAPGRLLRMVAAGMGRAVTPETVLTLCKHPLTRAGGDGRGPHLLHTRRLDLWLRRHGGPTLTPATLTRWAEDADDVDATVWAAWIAEIVAQMAGAQGGALPRLVDTHLAIASALADGDAEGGGTLWADAAGTEARAAMDTLTDAAAEDDRLSLADYRALIDGVLADREVREAVESRADVSIRGTLEARVQGADVTILAGLNEGVWPSAPAPDPWLNRPLRQAAGLLLPDRRIGLSAHDFQQGVAGAEVVLSRAVRDDDAATVPSRWLNRLTNLLAGLVDTGGPEALAAMRQRGAVWTALAAGISAPGDPVPRAPRPSPRPPAPLRPREISVTEVQTLIRDPYAVYGRRVLGLRPLDPLHPAPDAPLRGTVIHDIFEAYLRTGTDPHRPDAADVLLACADAILDRDVPWPAARKLWRARIARVADWFVAGERVRQADATPEPPERRGRLILSSAVTLTGKADRIDRRSDGRLVIYDYKTGAPPSERQIAHFDRQLLLEAAMAEAGAFETIPAARVAAIAYIGLGAAPVEALYDLDDPEAPFSVAETLAGLEALLARYLDPATGYTARRAMHGVRWDGDYDHLARFGEWTDADPPAPVDVP